MRYTRLRRAIESGTLVGTHGTPFHGSLEKAPDTSKKRRRPSPLDDIQAEGAGLNDDDFGLIRTRSGSRIERAIKTTEEYTECFGTDDDSDDGVPLVKRRASALSRSNIGTEGQSSVSHGSATLMPRPEMSLVVANQLNHELNSQLSQQKESPNAAAPCPAQQANTGGMSEEQSSLQTCLALISRAEGSPSTQPVVVLDSDDC